MPTYQYRCTACGNELEAVQKFTDPALTECPDCEGALRKVYNAVGVVFKGSGFYKTDSRNDAKGRGKGSSAKSGGSSESSGSSSKESSGSSSSSSSAGGSSSDGGGSSSSSSSSGAATSSSSGGSTSSS
ncbi:MAG: FmdB family transcriptional regulator [Propionibacterium sp.]|nr:FmdB family transcriptional regulator [Propionibacterium sp.]